MIKTINDINIFADGLDHPECLAVHPDGTVWAGGEAGQIYKISEDGKSIEEIANTGGFVLGIAFSPDASWLAACDLKKKCVWKYHLQSKSLTVFSEEADKRKFITPNYPVFDKFGNLYVSDSGNFRKVNGCIFKFNTEGEGEVWHEGPFSFTNGMALSRSQAHLYVVCSWLPGVEIISINPDGSAGERNVFVKIPETCPDGIAIDDNDDVYVTCYAPNTIFKIGRNRIPEVLVHDWEAHTLSNPTNIAFNVKNNKELFIANLGRWHIAKLLL